MFPSPFERAHKALLASLLLFVFGIKTGWGVVAVDLGAFRLKHAQKEGWRVVIFDVETQTVKKLLYIACTQKTQEKLGQDRTALYEDQDMVLYANKTLLLKQEAPDVAGDASTANSQSETQKRAFFVRLPEDWVLESEGKEAEPSRDPEAVAFAQQGGAQATQDGAARHYVNCTWAKERLTWQVARMLDGARSPGQGVMQVVWVSVACTEHAGAVKPSTQMAHVTLDQLSPVQVDVSKERGAFGEVLTDLTFESLGFEKLNAQNRSNQGFDGVFVHARSEGDCRVPMLVLTESKCRSESKTAQKYLEEDLSEARVVQRLGEIDEPHIKNRVQSFLDTTPHMVLKVAQRVLKDGRVSSAYTYLNPVLYILWRWPHLSDAPDPMKRLLVQHVLAGVGLPAHVLLDMLRPFLSVYVPSAKRARAD